MPEAEGSPTGDAYEGPVGPPSNRPVVGPIGGFATGRRGNSCGHPNEGNSMSVVTILIIIVLVLLALYLFRRVF